jgi:hypothetical protein
MNFAEGDTLTNEVDVDLNVLGAAMLHWIGRHVDGGDVVIVDKCSRGKRMMELLKKLTKLAALSHRMGDGLVLGFSTGARDGGLMLGGPRDQTVAVVDIVAQHGVM